MNLKKVVIISIIAFYGSVANAELIKTDWLESGDNGAVIDTNSGITWLQLNHSQKSMQDMLNQMVSGGNLEGWSFANREQIDSLWENDKSYIYDNMNRVNSDYISARWYRDETDDTGFIGIRETDNQNQDTYSFQFYDRSGYEDVNAYGWWIVKGSGSELKEQSELYYLPDNYIKATADSPKVPIIGSLSLFSLGLVGLLKRKRNS